MIIISHRGYWLEAHEKNTPCAFERSFTLGYGTETDVRDRSGTLVISHDPPKGDELTFDQFLELASATKPLLAINIKADGLAAQIHDTMKAHHYSNYFVFDMSIPDTRMQLRVGNPVLMRMSEVEPNPPYLDQASGIWLDAFEADLWRIDALKQLLADNKTVCLVSPELHQRDYQNFWHAIKQAEFDQTDRLILCTDVPEQATAFFQEMR